MADVPVTKADLAAALEASETRILERVERVETNLLSAFRQWSARFETRIGVHTMEIQGLDVRFAMVEERLAELERRVDKKQGEV